MNAKQLVGSVIDTVLKIVVIIAVVMFTYKYATVAYDFGYRIFAEEPVSSAETAKAVSISITEEAKVSDIGKVLEEKGLIRDSKIFFVIERLSKYHDELVPGIYELSSDMSIEEMLSVMADQQAEGEDSADEAVEEIMAEDAVTEESATEDTAGME